MYLPVTGAHSSSPQISAELTVSLPCGYGCVIISSHELTNVNATTPSAVQMARLKLLTSASRVSVRSANSLVIERDVPVCHRSLAEALENNTPPSTPQTSRQR